MSKTKFTLAVVVLIVAIAVSLTVWGVASSNQASGALAAAKMRNGEVRKSIEALEKKIPAESARAKAIESDNAELANALQQIQITGEKNAPITISRGAFAERFKQALVLARGDDDEAALRELLWCYRTGVARPDLMANLQIGPLVNALGKLGARHPEVLAELRERFEKGKLRVLGSIDDSEPLAEMAAIARVLNDDQMMVAIFDAIPTGNPQRAQVAIYAGDALVEARRYGDALLGQRYALMKSLLEIGFKDGAKAALRNYAVTAIATNVEVLAGAGDLVLARELAARLLVLDSSEATRALLQKHLERAGRAELLSRP
jgi:hypothetical protein